MDWKQAESDAGVVRVLHATSKSKFWLLTLFSVWP